MENFHLLPAECGLKVTHFDISLPMIERAKELAVQRGMIDNMTFVHGSLEDLSAYNDKQFDLVIFGNKYHYNAEFVKTVQVASCKNTAEI